MSGLFFGKRMLFFDIGEKFICFISILLRSEFWVFRICVDLKRYGYLWGILEISLEVGFIRCFIIVFIIIGDKMVRFGDVLEMCGFFGLIEEGNII